jgi:hypothetical protein
MANPAFPLSYEIDVGQNGMDTGGTVNLFGQTGVEIDVILDGYACPPDDNLFGVQAHIILDESLVHVSGCHPNSSSYPYNGPCDSSLSACSWQGDNYYTPDPDVWSLICSNFTFIQQVNQIKLGTFVVDCVGTGTTDMVVAGDLTAYGHPDFNDGYVADCNLESQYPDDGMVTIELLPPPCEVSVTPNPVSIQPIVGGSVVQPFCACPGITCPNLPFYEWSDDCTLGDVDQSGLLTVPTSYVGEFCQVCATDTANTGAGGLPPTGCAVVHIMPG